MLDLKNVQSLDAYSDEYKDTMEENKKYLENLYSDRKIDRVEEIKSYCTRRVR